MKIYISGKISGLPRQNVVEKFKWHAMFLAANGYNPINPVELNTFDEVNNYDIIIRISSLLRCEAIYMLKDWGQDKNSRLEYAIAKELGIRIFFQGENEILNFRIEKNKSLGRRCKTQ